MRKLRALLLLPLATCVFVTAYAQAPTSLQLGTPVERTLGPGQELIGIVGASAGPGADECVD
jgi:hypothetical protein